MKKRMRFDDLCVAWEVLVGRSPSSSTKMTRMFRYSTTIAFPFEAYSKS